MNTGSENSANIDVESLIEQRFTNLSPRLQQAARFIVDNPRLVALRSMRAVASRAQVDPSAMVRLAQDLGFNGYEALRDCYRRMLLVDDSAWTGRVKRIRSRRASAGTETLVSEILDQNQVNLAKTFSEHTKIALEQARYTLASARFIFVVGLRSLYPIAFYFHYALRLFSGNSVLLTGTGGTFADDLRLASENDVVIVFSYRPYARDAVTAVRFARSRGTKVVAVTDSKVSPVANNADIVIPVSNSSMSLLPAIVPFLAVAEALATLMVGDGGEETMRQLALSEEQLEMFRVYEEGRRKLNGR